MICLRCNKEADWLVKDFEYDKKYPACSDHMKDVLPPTSRVFMLLRLEKTAVPA